MGDGRIRQLMSYPIHDAQEFLTGVSHPHCLEYPVGTLTERHLQVLARRVRLGHGVHEPEGHIPRVRDAVGIGPSQILLIRSRFANDKVRSSAAPPCLPVDSSSRTELSSLPRATRSPPSFLARKSRTASPSKDPIAKDALSKYRMRGQLSWIKTVDRRS